MAIVGAEVQVTMHIGDASRNEYIRIRATVDGIETGDPKTLPKRLEDSRKTLLEVLKVAGQMIEDKVTVELGRQL